MRRERFEPFGSSYADEVLLSEIVCHCEQTADTSSQWVRRVAEQ